MNKKTKSIAASVALTVSSGAVTETEAMTKVATEGEVGAGLGSPKSKNNRNSTIGSRVAKRAAVTGINEIEARPAVPSTAGVEGKAGTTTEATTEAGSEQLAPSSSKKRGIRSKKRK